MDPVFPYGPNATRALSENRSQDLRCARRVCSIEPPRLACNLSCGQRRRRMLGRTTALCATWVLPRRPPALFIVLKCISPRPPRRLRLEPPVSVACGSSGRGPACGSTCAERIDAHARTMRLMLALTTSQSRMTHISPPSPDRASAILGAIFTTASGTCSCRSRSSFLARRRCQP